MNINWPKHAAYYCPECDAFWNESGVMHRHHEIMIKRKTKMTREEANEKLKSVRAIEDINYLITQLEALGLLKFDEPKKKVNRIFAINDVGLGYDGPDVNNGVNLTVIVKRYGTIRLEEWLEGLVLWVGGEIVWKSWEARYRKGDAVMIEYYDRLQSCKLQQAGTIK